MAGSRAYLDYNATAPLLPQVAEAMAAGYGQFGNPSSIHEEGRQARKTMEDARRTVARHCGAPTQQVFFTGSGSEANNFALRPGVKKDGVAATRLITTPIEHDCVLKGHGFGANATRLLRVDGNGLVDLSDLENALAEDEGSPALISIMLANNETGMIQPLGQISEIIRASNSAHHVFHSDCVQGVGKLDVHMKLFGLDMMTLSAHKFGGPKGVGAIVKSSDAIEFAEPLIKGGGQERRTRAGTENVAAIIGFAKAVEEASALLEGGLAQSLKSLREKLELGVLELAPDAHIFAKTAPRLDNTSCFAIPGVEADAALIQLDLAGVAVSSGSACSSGKVTPSHVLAAMGVSPDIAKGAIRASLGWATTEAHIDQFLAALKEIVERHTIIAARAV